MRQLVQLLLPLLPPVELIVREVKGIDQSRRESAGPKRARLRALAATRSLVITLLVALTLSMHVA